MDGATDRQRSVCATLETLAEAVEKAGLKPPAVIVIGEVAALSLSAGTAQGELAGVRVAVTGTEGFSARLAEKLKELGLGLEDRISTTVGLLSGGQRQALTLLMSTIVTPKLLLLDEHTAALDPKTAASVMDITERIVKENHITTLMITHNMRDALRYGNRLIMLHDGHVILDIAGEEKKKLTVEQLLALFSKASGSDEADDKLLLS